MCVGFMDSLVAASCLQWPCSGPRLLLGPQPRSWRSSSATSLRQPEPASWSRAPSLTFRAANFSLHGCLAFALRSFVLTSSLLLAHRPDPPGCSGTERWSGHGPARTGKALGPQTARAQASAPTLNLRSKLCPQPEAALQWFPSQRLPSGPSSWTSFPGDPDHTCSSTRSAGSSPRLQRARRAEWPTSLPNTGRACPRHPVSRKGTLPAALAAPLRHSMCLSGPCYTYLPTRGMGPRGPEAEAAASPGDSLGETLSTSPSLVGEDGRGGAWLQAGCGRTAEPSCPQRPV